MPDFYVDVTEVREGTIYREGEADLDSALQGASSVYLNVNIFEENQEVTEVTFRACDDQTCKKVTEIYDIHWNLVERKEEG